MTYINLYLLLGIIFMMVGDAQNRRMGNPVFTTCEVLFCITAWPLVLTMVLWEAYHD